MKSPDCILLKITGTLLKSQSSSDFCKEYIVALAEQCLILAQTHSLGIVVGGGNLFRGNQQGKILGLKPTTAHYAGMLATMMNGLMVQDIFEKIGLKTALFSALPTPAIGNSLSNELIDNALKEKRILIFVGGTGVPYFSTDTAAITFGLRIGAQIVWKATNVDGIYDSDPALHSHATLLKAISYTQALALNIGIMDRAALVLAQQYNMPLHIFNAFTPNAFLSALNNPHFGSYITLNGESLYV